MSISDIPTPSQYNRQQKPSRSLSSFESLEQNLNARPRLRKGIITPRDLEPKLQYKDLFDKIASYLTITELSLLAGLSRAFYREMGDPRHYSSLDFTLPPIPLQPSLMLSKLNFAGSSLREVTFPGHLKFADYKK